MSEQPLAARRGAPLSRTDVREVACPACRAEPGSPCRTPRKDGSFRLRKANHRERIHAAYAAKEPLWL